MTGTAPKPTRLMPPLSERDHVLGAPDAPTTLVEYGDYECPYCAKACPIVESILRQTGDRLLFAFRHFPLTRVHAHAGHAAEMAEIAATRGKFWPMHSLLYRNPQALDDRSLVAHAGRTEIALEWAAAALLSHRFAERVREHFMSGLRSGVNGTPTFFINGTRYGGPWDEASLLGALQGTAYAAPRR